MGEAGPLVGFLALTLDFVVTTRGGMRVYRIAILELGLLLLYVGGEPVGAPRGVCTLTTVVGFVSFSFPK